MKKLRNIILAVLMVSSVGGATLTLATPQSAAAACNERLLTFPAWYKGIVDGSCAVKNPADVGGLPAFLAKIGLNIVEFMLQLVGYLAVGFIMYGGFRYLTGAGEAADIASAKKTILNAVIGLVISIFSVAIVNVVAGAF